MKMDDRKNGWKSRKSGWKTDLNKEKEDKERRPVRDEAMRFLEYRSHTAYEVEQNLKKKEYPEEEIADCMEFLRDCHFIDDEAYSRRYIEYAVEKGRGPRRIRQELSQKGVSGELIDLGLEELLDGETQFETAIVQARKALKSGPADGGAYSEKELARAARRLAGLGYKASMIYEVLDGLRRDCKDSWD